MLFLVATSLTGAAKAAAWICFTLGGLLVIVGTGVGLRLSFKELAGGTGKPAKAKVEETKEKVEALSDSAQRAVAAPQGDAATSAEVTSKASAAESAVKEIEGLIAALPEKMRYSAFMILFGALLMSVANVEFGGHSIF
jgi:hypothetical protein